MSLAANDSAASVALGGIVLTRQPNISMESERLTISLSKIAVEYEFLNETDADISTEVAFPIPPYENSMEAGGIGDFSDFKLWVDGAELKYEVEAKAFAQRIDATGRAVGSKNDVTPLLRKYNVDIPSLGHYAEAKFDKVVDFERLAPAARKTLVDARLVEVNDDQSQPLWEVRKTYHWKQIFPAHKTLKVRHEYTPGFGFQGIPVAAFDQVSRSKYLKDGGDSARYDVGLLRDSCAEASLQKLVFGQASAALKVDPNNGYVGAAWVDYILTTANSWKTPIKKFELVIEKGPKRDKLAYPDDWKYVSLCWDGAIRRVGPQHFEASLTDFVPKRELKLLFLRMP